MVRGHENFKNIEWYNLRMLMVWILNGDVEATEISIYACSRLESFSCKHRKYIALNFKYVNIIECLHQQQLQVYIKLVATHPQTN
ncbi:CLUMA_CG004629, isoform A [Clunio marinus]|uniref:CLUMA_CG004629, isoform A n=1 Tax=Clunio marinus TaxID=568069 RepID=A0A1J1HU95_9DIPT|nr:CLUMA_CG004629, isoform A [Clunio marinus]